MLNPLKWLLIGASLIFILGIVGLDIYAIKKFSLIEKEFEGEIGEIRKEIQILKESIEQLKRELPEKLEENPLKEIDTSSWETYKDEKYGFEIKYPKDWFFLFPPPFFHIANKKNLNNTLDIRMPLISAGSAFNLPPEVFDEEIFISGNIPAFKKIYPDPSGKRCMVLIQWRYGEGGVIIYEYPCKDKNEINYYLNLFDKLLSTFKLPR